MDILCSSNSDSVPKHILAESGDIQLNGISTTNQSNTSRSIMKQLNNPADSYANNSPSTPCCDSQSELSSNVSSFTPPRLTTTTKKTMHVRALFDYDPNSDTGLPSRGLPFHHGDILHVVNASDREWWQAKQISSISDFNNTTHVSSMHQSANNNNINSNSTQAPTTMSSSTGLGIIPSCHRIERRLRTRLKRVNFVGKVTVIGATPYPHTSINNNHISSFTNSGIINHSPWDNDHNGSITNSKDNNNKILIDANISSNSNDALRINSFDTHIKNSNVLLNMPIVSSPNSSNVYASKKKRSGSLTRNLLKCFSYRSIKNDSVGLVSVTRTGSLDAVSQNRYPIIRSYDLVVPITISIARPLIFFGPLKDRVIDELLLQDSKFTTCILHTSRPQRPNERNGVDYYFVSSKSVMEEDIQLGKYIEVDRFQDHYYATSLESVRSMLQSGRICILDVGLDAAKYLEEIGLFPITILLKPKSVTHLRTLQRRLTDDQAKRSMEQIQSIEDENWRFLSAIITYESFDSVLVSVRNFVQLHSGPVIWVTSTLSNLPGVHQCLNNSGTPIISYHQQQQQSLTNGITNDITSALQSSSIHSVNSTQSKHLS
ncbi:Disks large 4 [Schistosoma japonicum]|uniref:Disks large 4 n=1 Tax=Schistosoma japonicum TaxID=6182 RepID=A0A4Z2DBU3_SCHJA|nr:Disks large 4 [Schistosoma japonicum]TNN13899.1 Disks large 4 [Schistosoma japonicum]TNN13900.1 Disks large 4 [Schistosoma japonicum]